jgi:hypothetical protein
MLSSHSSMNTEEKIILLLKQNKEMNILEISLSLKMDRHTVAKYLEVLRTKGLISYSSKGKSKFWKLSDNPLTELLGVNDFISNQVLGIFNNLDYAVSIQSKNFDIIWHNTKVDKKQESGKCYEVLKGKAVRCSNCPSEKVFETGTSHQSSSRVNGKDTTVISQPIKNEAGEVIAVVELIRREALK